MIVDPLPVAWRFDAIGTRWRIDTREPLPPEIVDAVAARVDRFDRDWSRFRSDSRIAALRTPGRHRLADDAGTLLAFYRDLFDATRGRVTPLVGRTLDAVTLKIAPAQRPFAQRTAHVGVIADQFGDVGVHCPLAGVLRQRRPVPDLRLGQFRTLALDAGPVGIVSLGGEPCACHANQGCRQNEANSHCHQP